MEQLDIKEYSLPRVLDKDCEYLKDLDERTKKLVNDISRLELNESEKANLLQFREGIIDTIKYSLQGDALESYRKCARLVKEVMEIDGAVTPINSSKAFWGNSNNKAKEVQLFRARFNETEYDFKANDMLHIPFNQREKVASQRFSIPGLPCLYFGNTSYCCWIELGKPPDNNFDVSPVTLDDKLKFLNLTFTVYDIDGFIKSSNNSKLLVDTAKMLLLNIACSYKIKNNYRTFKSEYIFPQLLMLVTKNLGVNGIIYYSKRTYSEIHAIQAAVDVALFTDFDADKYLKESESKSEVNYIYSSICDSVHIGRPTNFSMYRKLNPIQAYVRYQLNIDNCPYATGIGDDIKQIVYSETLFYNFDMYLFKTWNRDKDDWNK